LSSLPTQRSHLPAAQLGHNLRTLSLLQAADSRVFCLQPSTLPMHQPASRPAWPPPWRAQPPASNRCHSDLFATERFADSAAAQLGHHLGTLSLLHAADNVIDSTRQRSEQQYLRDIPIQYLRASRPAWPQPWRAQPPASSNDIAHYSEVSSNQ
jgi:hypothetical protein